MFKVENETRSTIILFIAILIAVLITVWVIISFDRPDDRYYRVKQTGMIFNKPNIEHIEIIRIRTSFA
jgi:hypothetical protein